MTDHKEEQQRVEMHLSARLAWTTGLLKCRACGGYQHYSYAQNGDLEIYHSCFTGTQATENEQAATDPHALVIELIKVIATVQKQIADEWGQ